MLNSGLSLNQYTIAPVSVPATTEPSGATSPTHGPFVTAAKTPARGVGLAEGIAAAVGEATAMRLWLAAGVITAVGIEVEQALKARTNPARNLFVIVKSKRFDGLRVTALRTSTSPLRTSKRA